MSNTTATQSSTQNCRSSNYSQGKNSRQQKSSAMQKTALAFNRAKGSLLPNNGHQANSDLLPMDPVQ